MSFPVRMFQLQDYLEDLDWILGWRSRMWI